MHAGAPTPDACQVLHFIDGSRQRSNVRRVSSARAVPLHGFLLLVKHLVELAQRLVAGGRKPHRLRRFLAVHFDLGDGIDDFVRCRFGIHCSCQ